MKLLTNSWTLLTDRDRSPDTHHVDQRMTWAATCLTTREEDAAYCLLGISKLLAHTSPESC